MGMGFKFQVGMGIWDGNGNEVTEMGGNWDEKSVPAHLCWWVVRRRREEGHEMGDDESQRCNNDAVKMKTSVWLKDALHRNRRVMRTRWQVEYTETTNKLEPKRAKIKWNPIADLYIGLPTVTTTVEAFTSMDKGDRERSNLMESDKSSRNTKGSVLRVIIN